MTEMKKNKSWPIGLTIVFVVFFLYLIGFIILSLMNRTDLVTEDYYEQEVAYQDQIDRVERSKDLSQNVNLEYNPSNQIITLEFPADFNPDSITGYILFFRPSDAKQDRIQTIQLDDQGIQIIDGKNLSKGMWRIKIFWQVIGEAYYDEKVLSLK
jgi:hypothetical protein